MCCFGPRFSNYREVDYTYEADGKKQRDEERRERGGCARKDKAHAGLSPGIFAVFCRHSICHGFCLLPEHEGEVSVSRLFFHRLRGGPPRIICYDRACTLHTCCLRREPWFFRNTRFTLDVLHSYNHECCSEGYDPKVRRALCTRGESAFFNTQAAEQANSALKQISTSVTFMTAEHAFIYTRSFLARRNRSIIAKLQKP